MIAGSLTKGISMVIGIDVGGTHLRAAGFTDWNDPRERGRQSFPTSDDFETDFHHVVEAITELAKGEDLAGIGLALPGTLDDEHRRLVETPNLHSWENQPIAER